MEKIRVIIADRDREYAETLTGYLIDRSMQLFRINCFSDGDCLDEFIGGDSPQTDIILASEFFAPRLSEYANQRDIPLLILSETGNTGKANTINKYCKADLIGERLKDRVKKRKEPSGIVKEAGNGTKTVVFFSPTGNCGCTFLAINTALALAAENRRVLYFNLEAVNSVGFYLSADYGDEGYGLADIVFDLRENRGNMRDSIEKGIIKSRDVSYFRPKENFIEKSDIKMEDIQFIISGIMEEKMFDFIITDLGNIFSKEKICFLSFSDLIYLISNTNEHSIFKLKELIKGMGLYGIRNGLELEGKTSIIWNRIRPGDMGGNSDMDFPMEQITIPEFTEGIISGEYLEVVLKGIKYG